MRNYIFAIGFAILGLTGSTACGDSKVKKPDNKLTDNEKLIGKALTADAIAQQQALQILTNALVAASEERKKAAEAPIRAAHNMVDGDTIDWETFTISRKADRDAADAHAKADEIKAAKAREALTKRHPMPSMTTPPPAPSAVEQRLREAREKVQSVPGPHSNGGGK